VNQVPLDNYNDVLWKIAASVPITSVAPIKFVNATRRTRRQRPKSRLSAAPTTPTTSASRALAGLDGTEKADEAATAPAAPTTLGKFPFEDEIDFDEDGNCNWIAFFHHAKQEQRFYHRKTKRVVAELPENVALIVGASAYGSPSEGNQFQSSPNEYFDESGYSSAYSYSGYGYDTTGTIGAVDYSNLYYGYEAQSQYQ
jgi:hypothetical protein